MKNISLFIIVKNEADKLKSCILSAKEIVGEIIVVDSNSTDGTSELAKQLGARVYQHKFKGFAEQKSFALSKCTLEWALSLDADEALSPELAAEIAAISDDTTHDGFYLRRVNFFLGGKMNYGGLNNEYILRLVRLKNASYTEVLVHESLKVSGSCAKLKAPMPHYSYGSIENYFEKFNKYTSLAARDLFNKGRKFNLVGTILRLPAEFLKRYALKLGFLDGIRGLIWAAFSSFYVFVKYIKLWRLIEVEKRQ